AAVPAGAGPPVRGEGRGSPTPSSDAAAPATTRVRIGSARRDTRTTRASSPPSTTTRAANLTAPTPNEPRTSLRTLRDWRFDWRNAGDALGEVPHPDPEAGERH